MAEVFVKNKAVYLEADKEEQISGKIKQIAQELLECQNQIRMSAEVESILKKRLAGIHGDLLTEAASLSKMSDALKEILKVYSDCETTLAGVRNVNEKVDLKSTGTDKSAWWQKFLYQVFGKDIDPNYTATTLEQEQAIDREMQQEIQKIRSLSAYSEEKWQQASVEERKEMLNEFMAQAASVVGVSVRPNIKFTYKKGNPDGTINLGQYTHIRKVISINSYIISTYEPEDSYTLFTTVVHELRHAYQHEAIHHPTRYQVSKETIDSWKDSFRTYRREQKKGYEAYRKILVEQDARSFAGQS